MSVKYKLYQDNREKSAYKGKWYARAVHSGVFDLDGIAMEIEENVSAKESDVYAVLKELVRVMKRHLQNSEIVVMPGLGRFKIGISTSPALTAKAFNSSHNIRSSHIIFQPQVKIDVAHGTRFRALLDGCTFEETVFNDVKKDPDDSSDDPQP